MRTKIRVLSYLNSSANQLVMKSVCLGLIPFAFAFFFEFSGCDNDEEKTDDPAAIEVEENHLTQQPDSPTKAQGRAVTPPKSQKKTEVNFGEALQNVHLKNLTPSEANSRIEIINRSISFRTEAGRGLENDRFYHVAEVTPPLSPRGDPLSATCVQIAENYAFVSWHWNAGKADYHGVLEIYNLHDPGVPKLQSSLVAPDIDFNHLHADIDSLGNGKLYVTGSESPRTQNLKSPAYLGEFIVKKGRFQVEVSAREDLSSYSGNCVIKHNGKLYTVSGSTNGALSRFDLNSGKKESALKVNGLKYIAGNDKFIVVLAQSKPQSQLAVYPSDASSFEKPLRTIPVGAITPENGKNVVFIDDEFAYISTGRLGLKVFDLMTSSSSPFYTYHTLLPGATNGVAADGDFIYIANGSSGLHVLHKRQFMFTGNFSHTGSANFVTTGNHFIIVANGKGGLTIIRREPVV